MIRLNLKNTPAEPQWLELPALRDGDDIPAIRLSQPTLASLRASHALARRAVPGRDEDEDEADYLARLKDTLAAYGALLPEGRLDLSARIKGVVEAIALTAHAEALIVEWRGFGGEEGDEIEPGPIAIRAAMRNVYIALRVDHWISDRLAGSLSEGNG